VFSFPFFISSHLPAHGKRKGGKKKSLKKRKKGEGTRRPSPTTSFLHQLFTPQAGPVHEGGGGTLGEKGRKREGWAPRHCFL